MAKPNVSKNAPQVISFTACLKSTSPSSKPIKFGSEGDSEIVLEAPASEMTNVVRMLSLLGNTFQVSISA